MLTHVEAHNARPDLDDLTFLLGGDIATDPFQVREIQGLGPVKADITSTPANTDGEFPNGSRVGKRNIVITMGFNPDWDTTTVSSLRNQLYDYFTPKLPVRLRFYRDDGVPVGIEGVVESFEPNIFSKDPEIQISILCLEPYFVAVSPTVVNGVVRQTFVAFVEHTYIGTAETGFVFKVEDSASNPSFNGAIYLLNRTLVDELIGVTVNIDTTEYLEISTVRGAKHVREVNVANPTIYANRLSTAVINVDWPKMHPGLNKFDVSVTADPGQDWSITYYAQFGGL